MKKILAIILALLMTLSLTACANSNNKETESETKAKETQNQNEGTEKATEGNKEDDSEKLPESEDEILKYVLNALSATEAHKGDITIIANSTDSTIMKIAPDGEGAEESNFINTSGENAFASLDAKNKVIYIEEANEYKSGDDPDNAEAEKMNYMSKSFYNENKLYTASKYSSNNEEESETEFSLIHESRVEGFSSLSELEFLKYPTEVYSGIKLAKSFAEVKDAFNTALPNVMTSFYNEEIENATPNVNSEVSAKIVDGVCTFIISIKSSATTTNEGTEMIMAIDIYHEISAKDGKVIDFKSKIDMSQKAVMGETVLQDYSQSFNFALAFEYSFAKAKYDAFEVTLPEDLTEIPVIGAPTASYDDLYITLYINGIEAFDVSDFGGDTPKEALDNILSYVDTDRATVKIFSDEAMTKELVAESVTNEEIWALEKVYLSVTPKADYALVISNYTERNDYSTPYNIVIPSLYFLSHSSVMKNEPADLIEVGEFELNETYVEDESSEIWINGVKQESKTATITVEGGKIYNIEYVKVLSDKDFTKA